MRWQNLPTISTFFGTLAVMYFEDDAKGAGRALTIN